MDGFAVSVPRLRENAAASTALGQGIAAVDLASVARIVATAMPGGATAQAAGVAEQTWTAAITGISQAWAQHGDRLDGTAQSYDGADTAAAHELAGIGQR